MPRRTWTTVLATLAVLFAIVALHPSDRLAPVRRAIGLGSERVLPAPAVVRQGGTYAFTMTQPDDDGEPVGWDPCMVIRFQVNPEGEPAGGRALVDRAIARISAATGLAFEDEGDTVERPFPGGIKIFGGPDPVVIGWGTPAEYPDLAGAVAGVGGAMADQGRGRVHYVSGGVALDREAFTDVAVAQQPRVMEAIVLHELAHVVGLAHVSEPMELMFADNSGQVELGPGDREGLARLGSLPCD
ncbi:hypothetical protein L2K70_02460 [Nocardioides KLBMP 9356]|uniref:Matrixin family metalloprotease n=1 Tax=Nocardioides potassii TaxID=2911371 RepID=A0ABS9H5B6_9ACTN|nr:hypothetical protein [Nocardioides potassii]MCF6376455.1 hypothetical protein [Nocardioides potassii]